MKIKVTYYLDLLCYFKYHFAKKCIQCKLKILFEDLTTLDPMHW